MGVWKLNSGGIPPIISKLEVDSLERAEFEMKVKTATELVKEINLLLSIATHSSDFQTVSTRLDAANEKTIELQKIAAEEPRITLTNFGAAEKLAEKARDMLVKLQYDRKNDAALWCYHARFYLKTPREHLLNHGLMMRCSESDLPIIGDLVGGAWHHALPTFKEMGVDILEFSRGSVASDMGSIPADGGFYMDFLLEFRAIVESGIEIPEMVIMVDALCASRPDFGYVKERHDNALTILKRAHVDVSNFIKKSPPKKQERF
ncbi:hypothetical protein [Solimicrobium silvestre]|uniref:hypothetical protein n=1 Tax=Solimicrobium silvestre TaxID=2099400 RepID=UPI000CFA9EAF|nr:hypothetical protein [Solimicrobium silvestre]